MPAVSFLDCLENIKKNKKCYPILLLHGFHEFMGQVLLTAMSRHCLEEKSSFNFRRIYFDSDNEAGWTDVLQLAKSSSFFIQSHKIVIITIREEGKLLPKKDEAASVKKYFSSPNPDTILVIYISFDAMKDDYQQFRKSKLEKFLKDFQSPNLTTVDLDRISERELKNFIKNDLLESGITITANALEKLLEVRGDDILSVVSQLPKLAIGGPKGKGIDSEDIEEIVTGVEAHSIWDLTDAIESEDTKKYLKVLKYLVINGIKPTLIIGTLITHYNKIYTAKFLLSRHFPVNDIGKVLQQPSFFLNKFIQSVRSFSDQRINYILDIIYKLDYESKTGGESGALISLENFIFQISAAAFKN